MPNFDKTTNQIEAETDRFLLEQAKAFVRDLRAAAQHAPYGKVVQRAETVAVLQGRELVRQSLEAIVQEQNDLLEKKRNANLSLRRRTRTSRIFHPKNIECRRKD